MLSNTGGNDRGRHRSHLVMWKERFIGNLSSSPDLFSKQPTNKKKIIGMTPFLHWKSANSLVLKAHALDLFQKTYRPSRFWKILPQGLNSSHVTHSFISLGTRSRVGTAKSIRQQKLTQKKNQIDFFLNLWDANTGRTHPQTHDEK